MKKIFSLLICLFVLSGCSAGLTETKVIKLDVEELDGFIRLTPEAATEYFFFDPADIRQCRIFISEDGMCADEAVIIEAVDAAALERLVKCLDERLESQRLSFKGYAPEEYKKLENVKVSTRGLYCFYFVGNVTSSMFGA